MQVSANISFKSRGMLSAKIKGVALKRSRKCAALAAELLELAQGDDDALGAATAAGPGADGEGVLAACRGRGVVVQRGCVLVDEWPPRS